MEIGGGQVGVFELAKLILEVIAVRKPRETCEEAVNDWEIKTSSVRSYERCLFIFLHRLGFQFT
jgi:hypothetical protein